jgi:hypothetical protein
MGFTTSPNLGPLTTYWTPPTTCLSTITSVNDWDGSLWMGMTGNVVDLDCYPSNFATDAVYSPAVCPSDRHIILDFLPSGSNYRQDGRALARPQPQLPRQFSRQPSRLYNVVRRKSP